MTKDLPNRTENTMEHRRLTIQYNFNGNPDYESYIIPALQRYYHVNVVIYKDKSLYGAIIVF